MTEASQPVAEAGAEVGVDDRLVAPVDRVKQLEAEGDIAADYLEELLDIADLDGDLDMDVEGDRAAVSIVGADLDVLVGDEGQVLEALQELTRLAVYRETGERSRLMLGIGGDRGGGVGEGGEVLEALRGLARLAVYRETGERSRLMLDIGGYRADVRRNLVLLAAEAIDEVRSSGEAVKLAPMSPFERKVVHDCVAEAGLKSESEGVEPTRSVVILPSA